MPLQSRWLCYLASHISWQLIFSRALQSGWLCYLASHRAQKDQKMGLFDGSVA